MEGALYNLESAHAMLKTRRFLYVGFLCHQAVEKPLKALYCHGSDDDPPHTLNLNLLAIRSSIAVRLSPERQKLLDDLMPPQLQIRHPSDRSAMLASLTPTRCKDLFSRTKEWSSWISMFLMP